MRTTRHRVVGMDRNKRLHGNHRGYSQSSNLIKKGNKLFDNSSVSAMAMSLIDESTGRLTISIQSKKEIRRIIDSLKAAKPQIALQAVCRLDISLDNRPSEN